MGQDEAVTILFADVSGSTRLYDTLGDARARAIVARAFELMEGRAGEHRGRLVKTIGDAVMCTFPEPGDAAEAAIAMQGTIASDLRLADPDATGLAIRIGFHHGPVIHDAGDVFGDAVNIAARMEQTANRGCIVTTRETVDLLPDELRAKTRQIDNVTLMGKTNRHDVFEVVWQNTNLTQMAQGSVERTHRAAAIHLRYRDRTIVFDSGSGAVSFGRGDAVDMPVDDELASRTHARIENRRGKFVLVDTSTNGTFLDVAGQSLELRRESFVLTGAGSIAFGRPVADSAYVLRFACE